MLTDAATMRIAASAMRGARRANANNGSNIGGPHSRLGIGESSVTCENVNIHWPDSM
jgi:hypothetical protein